MALALEVELLTGVYRAALPDGAGAEWPPHPERVLSALAQAWGDGGNDPGEREVLEWLESLPAPEIEADRPVDCGERDAPEVYVPVNDARGDQPAALPVLRLRKERAFRAVVPANPLVRYRWADADPSPRQRAALAALVRRVASLGHSTSLARFALIEREVEDGRLWRPAVDGPTPLRVPHQGRIEHLEVWLRNGQRPRTGMTVRYRPPGHQVPSQHARTVFGGTREWFVFEETGGLRPDILAFAHVATRVRSALMALGPQPAPSVLSGHAHDGTAVTSPHVAVVPLANVGWGHSTGDLLGFAVVLPREITSEDRVLVLQALAKLAHIERGDDAATELVMAEDAVWTLQHAAAPSRASLRPGRWCGTATVWASATPVVLDRFPGRGDVVEGARLIAASCRNIGLPDPVDIELHKHSSIAGAPSAYVARGPRSAPEWSFPRGAAFAGRPRCHVVLRFATKIEGPVLLGSGRFYGLGLCLPAEAGSDG